jgi:TPR repeat protein
MENSLTKIALVLIACFVILFSLHATAQVHEMFGKELKNFLKVETAKANAGDVKAMGDLAEFYAAPNSLSGVNYSTDTYDYRISLKWAIKGVNLNDPRCTFLAARSAENVCSGDEKRRNGGLYDSINLFYNKAAQQLEYPPAMVYIGDFYLAAGQYYNETFAVNWYTSAANKNYAPAIQKLAELKISKGNPTQLGDEAYGLQDFKTAATNYLIAVQYNRDREAMYKLGMMYKRQEVNPWIEAFRYFRSACELGHGPSCYEVGVEAYRDEKWHPQKFQEAWDYFNRGMLYGDKNSEIMSKELQAIRSHGMEKAGPSTEVVSKQKETITTKTCPVCFGSRTVTGYSTSESRNWDQKTITFTDHKTTSPCGRCNGTGTISY